MKNIIKFMIILVLFMIIVIPLGNKKYTHISIKNAKNLEVYLSPQDGSYFYVTGMSSVIKDSTVVLNGTFFNIGSDNQPLGPVLTADRLWIPTQTIFDGSKAKDLYRYFLAAELDGRAYIGHGACRYIFNLGKKYKFLIGGLGGLVENGKNILNISLKQGKFRDCVVTRYSVRSRTAFGINKKDEIIFIYSDCTLDKLAEYMIQKGAIKAVFCDGGGSAGIYIKNKTQITPRQQPTYILIKEI